MSIRSTLSGDDQRHSTLRGREVRARCLELLEMVQLPTTILDSRHSQGGSGGPDKRTKRGNTTGDGR